MDRNSSRNEWREDGNDLAEVTINIPMIDGVDISEMRKTKPRALRESAGGISYCISRAPRSLVEVNAEAYKPRILSIGPYHRGLKETKMIEEHKWRYLDSLLSRLETGPWRISFSYLFQQMAQIQEDARKCYSEETGLRSDEFVMMMLLDGCFIVELLCRYNDVVNVVMLHDDDPIFSCRWIRPLILRDLIKLENQLPFFVLQLIFDLSNLRSYVGSSLSALALKFFSSAIYRPSQVIKRYEPSEILGESYEEDECLHLLDLLRDSFIPLQADRPREENSSADVIHCATKLVKVGIKFKPAEKAESLLEISFKNGVLEIPRVTIDDFHASFLKNCVAFEQTYKYVPLYFTAYATFLDRLIDTERDVGLLIDKNIISNFLGSEKEVAKFYNDTGRDVIIDLKRCYLSKQFEEVRKYNAGAKHYLYEKFVSRYFSSTWSAISAIAAAVLLLLTVAQTVFAALGLRSH